MNVKEILSSVYNDLNIGVCPYCNRNYTSIIEIEPNEEQIKKMKYLGQKPDKPIKYVLPSFDHYFPKTEYPYLSLSLWNLIPTCEYCNNRFKNQFNIVDSTNAKITKTPEYLHPYLNGFKSKDSKNQIRFELELPEDNPGSIYSAIVQNNSSEFYDKFEINFISKSKDSQFLNKAKNSIELFALREVYNQINKKDAVDIAAKTILVNNAYKKSLAKILEDSLPNDYRKESEEMLKLYADDIGKNLEFLAFGHLKEQNNELREPLSLMKTDIIKQFSLDSDNSSYDWIDIKSFEKKLIK